MSQCIRITSDDLLDDVNHSFRVSAGPGAGKTHWLASHIRNVIRNSTRISPSSSIGCISYTNIAAGQILERLEAAADYVDVSTIHSFLYRFVVKPYLYLLKDSGGERLVNHVLVDGHDEHRPSMQCIADWFEATGGRKFNWYKKQSEVFCYLKTLAWQRDETTGEWSLRSSQPWKKPDKYFPTSKLSLYKTFYWQQGIIDHEDVLYLSYRILDEYPLIRTFLSAKFPYLFIDEFQDTNPVQTQVVKWLAAEGTTIGVIGDVEQSIYGFQGAKYEHFTEFDVPGITDYQIPGNRRSSSAIVDTLNHVRQDGLSQDALRMDAGDPVAVCVGDVSAVVKCLKERVVTQGIRPAPEFVVLTRRNKYAGLIRRVSGGGGDELWDELAQADRDRARFLEHVVAAGEIGKRGHYSAAVAMIIKGIRIKKGSIGKPFSPEMMVSDLQRRGLAVAILEYLMSQYESLSEGSLLEAYTGVSLAVAGAIPGLSLSRAITGKGFSNFAKNTAYADLAACVNLTEESREIRTIHKAKAAEFPSVLVCLEQEAGLNHILAPKASKEDEERRIVYVALSRAKDCLVITVPELSEANEKHLRKLNLDVRRCGQCNQKVIGTNGSTPVLVG